MKTRNSIHCWIDVELGGTLVGDSFKCLQIPYILIEICPPKSKKAIDRRLIEKYRKLFAWIDQFHIMRMDIVYIYRMCRDFNKPIFVGIDKEFWPTWRDDNNRIQSQRNFQKDPVGWISCCKLQLLWKIVLSHSQWQNMLWVHIA